jgi:hypothetical protein
MEIGVAVVLVKLVLTYTSCSLGVSLPLLLYPRGRGYKEGSQVGYNMIHIMTLSLLAYFTYIFYRYNYLRLGEHVMIIWNLLDSGLSHSGPLLGLPSLCGMVPRVSILVSSP